MRRGATTKYLPNRKELHLNDYLPQRNKTGICETCGYKEDISHRRSSMELHPKCDACKILCGHGHVFLLSVFRGYELCGACRYSWGVLERVAGREVNLDEFIDPSRIKPPPLPSNLHKLGLCIATKNTLHRRGIRTIKVLSTKSTEDLLALPMVGPKRGQEIQEALGGYNG